MEGEDVEAGVQQQRQTPRTDEEAGERQPLQPPRVRRGSNPSGAFSFGHAARRRPPSIENPVDLYGATSATSVDAPNPDRSSEGGDTDRSERRGSQRRVSIGGTHLSTVESQPGSPIVSPSAASIGRHRILTRTLTLITEAHPFNKMTKFFVLPPEDSVYSYFLFMPPIEQKREKRYLTPLTIFAAVLVFINFIMQGGLLYVVGLHIMQKHVEWVSSLVHLRHQAWYHIFPMPYNYAPPKCHGKGSSLCSVFGDDGMVSCAPKSIQILTDWQLLDIDGDGVWSKSEAYNTSLGDKAQCEYNVDLPLMYEGLVTQLKSSELKPRVDEGLSSGDSIHKAYFDWYLHKPMLCMYGDADMCGPLFQRGFFDEALSQEPAPMFTDVAGALKYCNRILREECFDILPNTYRVWRLVSEQQCGAKLYGQSEYQGPVNGDGMPMVTVDYVWLAEYASTKNFKFRLFLCILLVTFLSVMALEARSIFKTFVWTKNFPKDTGAGHDGHIIGDDAIEIKTERATEDSELKVKEQSIHKVRDDHRACVVVMTTFRLCLWVVLLYSGVMFLTTRPRYLTLIFDALSLVFIFEIDELLYRTMLRIEFRNDHLNTIDMIVPQLHGGSLEGHLAVAFDMTLFFVIIFFSAAVVVTYCSCELDPLIDSLECLCSGTGERCYESQQYGKAWWDDYWAVTLPAANKIIDQFAGL